MAGQRWASGDIVGQDDISDIQDQIPYSPWTRRSLAGRWRDVAALRAEAQLALCIWAVNQVQCQRRSSCRQTASINRESFLRRDRIGQMVQFISGSTKCALCAKVCMKLEDTLCMPAFLPSSHHLHSYSDSAFHSDCLAKWEKRSEFLALLDDWQVLQASASKPLQTAAEIEEWQGKINAKFVSDSTTISFTMLRLDYYLSGRVLMFSSCLKGAGLMLGYAIESHFKSALSLVDTELSPGDEKLQKHSHNLPALLNACRQLGFFDEIKVSPELIEFADDHLNQRYPSQQRRKQGKAHQMGRVMSFGVNDILAYDDLICQLDDELYRFTGNPLCSIGVRAALSADSTSGRMFFHSNAPAVSRLEKYANIVKEIRPDRTELIAELDKGEEGLWTYEGFGVSIGPGWRELSASNHAENFKYNKAIEWIDENGEKRRAINL